LKVRDGMRERKERKWDFYKRVAIKVRIPKGNNNV